MTQPEDCLVELIDEWTDWICPLNGDQQCHRGTVEDMYNDFSLGAYSLSVFEDALGILQGGDIVTTHYTGRGPGRVVVPLYDANRDFIAKPVASLTSIYPWNYDSVNGYCVYDENEEPFNVAGNAMIDIDGSGTLTQVVYVVTIAEGHERWLMFGDAAHATPIVTYRLLQGFLREEQYRATIDERHMSKLRLNARGQRRNRRLAMARTFEDLAAQKGLQVSTHRATTAPTIEREMDALRVDIPWLQDCPAIP